MDRFKTAEEYIRYEIISNKGTQNVIDKDKLIQLANSKGIEIKTEMKKGDIYTLLRGKISLEDIVARCEHLGVSSYSFQIKFEITHQEVKRMARLGIIQITGKERFRANGKYRYADLYSVFDYFRLIREDVHNWLAENQKGINDNKRKDVSQ